MENDLKSVLAECGFGFKKKFGQNFITDKNLLTSIVAQSGVQSGETVIEIGCGAGTLTRAIAEKAGRVIAFEVDTSLKPVLGRTLAGVENAEIVFKDFLKVNLNIRLLQTFRIMLLPRLSQSFWKRGESAEALP